MRPRLAEDQPQPGAPAPAAPGQWRPAPARAVLTYRHALGDVGGKREKSLIANCLSRLGHRLAALSTALLLFLLVLPAGASALPCTAAVTARQVEAQARPGAALRHRAARPGRADRRRARRRPCPSSRRAPTRRWRACARPAGPFVLRLNRFFWSDGEAGFRRYLGAGSPLHPARLPDRAAGALPPEPRAGGRPRAPGRDHVREVVRRFGRNPRGDRAPDRQRGQPHVLAGLARTAPTSARRRRSSTGVIAAKRRGAPARAAPPRDRLQLGLPARPRQRAALLAGAARPRRRGRSWRARLDRPRRLPGHGLPAGGAARAASATAMVNAMRSLRCYARIAGHLRAARR